MAATAKSSSTSSSDGRRWWHTQWGAAERVTIDDLAIALHKASSSPLVSLTRSLSTVRWIIQSSASTSSSSSLTSSGGGVSSNSNGSGSAGTVSFTRFEQFLARFGPLHHCLYRASSSILTSTDPPLPLPW
jgi:hypothetical protein